MGPVDYKRAEKVRLDFRAQEAFPSGPGLQSLRTVRIRLLKDRRASGLSYLGQRVAALAVRAA